MVRTAMTRQLRTGAGSGRARRTHWPGVWTPGLRAELSPGWLIPAPQGRRSLLSEAGMWIAVRLTSGLV